MTDDLPARPAAAPAARESATSPGPLGHDTVRDVAAVPVATRAVYGWYGDDFTGATDTLATLATNGLRSLLFLDVPDARTLAAAGPLDAIGIAGSARAMAPDAMRTALAPVGSFFEASGVPVLHYKVCSTFDSAPSVGNIAVAVQTLAPHVAQRFVPIIGGQPNLGRHCVFGQLFARAGARGETFRIDRHPTMSRHPVTPMGEADLRRHFEALGLAPMGAVPVTAYAADAGAALEAELAALPAHGVQPVLFDVLTDADLAAVGLLLADHCRRGTLLAVGGSSVAQALAPALRAWSRQAGASGPDGAAPDPGLAPAAGPVFVFAGSLSPVTARQIDAATCYQRIAAHPQRWLDDADYRDTLLDTVLGGLRDGRHVLLYTGDASEARVDTSAAGTAAQLSADFITDVVHRQAESTPLRRVGIAGGDTSSHATLALGLWGLSYLTRLGAGVTVSRTHSHAAPLDGVELMLKGGQVGDEDIFDQLVRGTRTG